MNCIDSVSFIKKYFQLKQYMSAKAIAYTIQTYIEKLVGLVEVTSKIYLTGDVILPNSLTVMKRTVCGQTGHAT